MFLVRCPSCSHLEELGELGVSEWPDMRHYHVVGVVGRALLSHCCDVDLWGYQRASLVDSVLDRKERYWTSPADPQSRMMALSLEFLLLVGQCIFFNICTYQVSPSNMGVETHWRIWEVYAIRFRVGSGRYEVAVRTNARQGEEVGHSCTLFADIQGFPAFSKKSKSPLPHPATINVLPYVL